jgi:beta-fructofuranosidase
MKSKLILCFICSAVLMPQKAINQPGLSRNIRDKTLVAWVALANTDQRGGSALTLDDGFSHFDGIVYGERVPGTWMAGSDNFRRSGKEENSSKAAVTGTEEFQMVAIAYKSKEINIFLNGRLCLKYESGTPQDFPPLSTAVFGRRHLDMSGDGFLQGRITDARIYERALSEAEIAVLVPDRITGPEPLVWWSFSGGSLLDETGRFGKVTVSGNVKCENGCLVLGDRQATMIAEPIPDGKTMTGSRLIPEGLPVPKEVIRTTREFRERLLSDPYRPAYHFAIPEDVGIPGDPNGAFWHEGRYHLMYLYSREGSGFCWGHISSTDLVHWRHHPDAIGPGNGDEGCFSGGAFLAPDGKAYLSYWELWGDKGIGMAVSDDPEFNNWTKLPENPVIKSTEWGITETGGQIFGSADPSNIWMNKGKYYILTGNLLVLNKYGRQPDAPANLQGDRTYLFESKDLKKWEYLHPFYESNRKWTDQSEDNMCPSFLPLPSSPNGGAFSGKHLMLFISHNKGCQYYIGTYRDDHFYPETHGRMTWTDNAYFAPEALVDGNGRQIMWAWIFDDRPEGMRSASGWTGVYGLPRSLWLGEDGTLGMQPVEELKMLRMKEKSKSNFIVKASDGETLDSFGSSLMELEIVMEIKPDQDVQIAVCRSEDGKEETVLSYLGSQRQLTCDATRSSVNLGRKNIETAPFELRKGELLTLRIFVDRSVVEVFANDRQAIGRAVYPELGGHGIRIRSKSGDVKVLSFKAWELAAANPY